MSILPPQLDPHATAVDDPHCEHCDTNLANPYSVLGTPCVENPQQCVACCAGACEDCADAIGTHHASYRSQRDPSFPETHDLRGEAA